MYPNEVQQAQRSSSSVAGKVFILGEYAVLAGLQSVVAAVGPRFRLSWASPNAQTPRLPPFASGSPAARLIDWAKAQGLPDLDFSFVDPYHGQGGFGASSAQFALVYQTYAELADWDRRWDKIWRLYRELFATDRVPPSGADLVTQWRGGVTYFDPANATAVDLWPVFNWSCFLIFSASGQEGRKVATHRHLDELAARGFPGAQGAERALIDELKIPLLQGVSAIREGNPGELALALTEYADALWRGGLETPSTHEDRRVLRELPDVLAVKGAGALQADAVIVMMQPGSAQRDRVIQLAESRGLRLVSDGLPNQMGVNACRE